MANDPDPETSASVSTGEVRVEKAFEADRFPVPAIAFEIESLADDPIRIRLVDDIPESFAMEGVGFHPDFEGDNWTAYGDHRVAYERTLDPGESVLTVYGIRIDDDDEATAFLGEPTVELVEADDADASTADVLGRETTQVVRDALSGEGGEDLSGLDAEPLLEDRTAPGPRDTDDDLASVLDDRDRDVTAVEVQGEATPDAAAADADPAASREATAAAEPDAAIVDALDEADTETAGDAESTETGDATLDPTDAGSGVAAGSESVAAALAAELRADRVDDDDLAVLREELEGAVPTSVEVRVGRLQSQVEDLLAYRGALADFLDENGTADVLDDLNDAVADLSDRVEDLEADLSDASADREALRADVADASDRLDAVADDLEDLERTAERLDERLTEIEELESDVDEVREELEDLRSFRDRLNSAFGSEAE
jgi:hypothetical protein